MKLTMITNQDYLYQEEGLKSSSSCLPSPCNPVADDCTPYGGDGDCSPDQDFPGTVCGPDVNDCEPDDD